jgi:hypothetical protein
MGASPGLLWRFTRSTPLVGRGILINININIK